MQRRFHPKIFNAFTTFLIVLYVQEVVTHFIQLLTIYNGSLYPGQMVPPFCVIMSKILLLCSSIPHMNTKRAIIITVFYIIITDRNAKRPGTQYSVRRGSTTGCSSWAGRGSETIRGSINGSVNNYFVLIFLPIKLYSANLG